MGPHGQVSSTSDDPPAGLRDVHHRPRKTLAAGWNGTSWTIQTTPNPTARGGGNVLSGFVHLGHGVHRGRVLHRTARATRSRWPSAGTAPSWAIQPVPLPSGARTQFLLGVSCTSATACTAVGTYPLGAGTIDAGRALERHELDGPVDPEAAVEAAWRGCPALRPRRAPRSGGTATAPGSRSPRPGTARRGRSSPRPVRGDRGPLGGVVHVGHGLHRRRREGTPVTCQAQAQRGTAPPGRPIASVAERHREHPGGVSCVSATACTAVGNYFLNSFRTLAEAWNGSTWTIQATPNPSGAQSALTCERSPARRPRHAPRSGTPTGEPWPSAGAAANWTIQPTPNPAGLPALSGVSCTSGTACIAVGNY